MAALLGKHIDAAAVSEYAPPLEAGETKILIETGPDRLAPISDVPTLKELGYPLAPTIFYGIAGPAGLPGEVVKTWEDTMAKIVETPKYKEMMDRLKTIPSFARHDAFAKQCVEDYRLMGEALKKIK
jgi:tripartite-type tricarboxylate transporter receptor subunit TctC